MKKSFDYFKTLKEMSVTIGDAYKNMVTTNEFNKETIRFSGLKWELSHNLFNEFVAPVERNDIYHMAGCLSEELYYISKLSNIITLADIRGFSFVESISSIFDKQSYVFRLLSDSKNYEKIFSQIGETKAVLNGVNTSIVLSIKNCLKSAEQPLLKYAIISGFYDIYKATDETFGELQRVVINNN